MSYTIVVTNNFNRKMRKLNAENRERASRIIRELQSEPYQYKELSGRLKGIRSARFGDHRILYIRR